MEILLSPKATDANHWINIGGALSRLASQQEASQENWFKTRSWQNLAIGGACLFTLHSLLNCQQRKSNSENVSKTSDKQSVQYLYFETTASLTFYKLTLL